MYKFSHCEMEIWSDKIICSDAGTEFVRQDERFPDDSEKIILCLLTPGALLIEEYDPPLNRTQWEAIADKRAELVLRNRSADIEHQTEIAEGKEKQVAWDGRAYS
jgi:hypothetical protein